MALFTVGELIEVTGSRLLYGDPGRPVEGVTSDSRLLSPGDMFVAIKGERADGHLFVPEVLSRGASCALVSKPSAEIEKARHTGGSVVVADDPVKALGLMAKWYRSKFSVKVIGVTGSVGKTTTKDMIASVLSTRFNTIANRGNLNTEVGVPLTLFRLRPEHEVAVIEMAMRGPGQIRYLAGLAMPSVGVITNIGEAHLELMGSIENTARAKAELLEALPADGVAVLNRDNPWVVAVGEKHPGKKIWYSVVTAADISATDIESRADKGMEFTLVTPSGIARVTEPLPGNHNVSNALAAAAVGHALGLTIDEIKRGLGQLEATGMRSQIIDMGDWRLINDAYNASPSSTRAALAILKDVAGRGRSIAVLGDMLELGTYTRLGHLEVGESVVKHCVDVLIAVGHLAREIARSAREKGHQNVHVVDSNEEATSLLKSMIRPGDTVLIKGSRGMHMEDIVSALKALYGSGGPIDGRH